MKFVLGGIIVLIVAIMLLPHAAHHATCSARMLIVVFGFLFVTVSSRLTGEIGSSSNPISGMTVATLLLTCLVFLVLGWTGRDYYVTALSIGAIVCIASSNGGTTSQDLKTGFLVGATPRRQQIAILVGALRLGARRSGRSSSGSTTRRPSTCPRRRSVADCPAGCARRRVAASRDARVRCARAIRASATRREYRVWHNVDGAGRRRGEVSRRRRGHARLLRRSGHQRHVRRRPTATARWTKFDAPKATLMSYIIKGILGRELPWGLVLLGVMIAIVLELAGIPSLAFAVGVYLPLSSSSPIFVGGIVRWLR